MARIKCDHCNGTIRTNEELSDIRNKNKKYGGVSITWSEMSRYDDSTPLYYYICSKCSDELFKFLTKGIEEDGENGK